MSLNGSGPDAVATAVEARKTDQLASEITSEDNIAPTHAQWSLISAIKEDLVQGEKAERKADKHHRSAGQLLKKLKDTTGSWAEWEALLKTHIGIGKSRASELMAIAAGTRSVEQVRADGAGRKAKERAKSLRDVTEKPEPGNGVQPKPKSTSQDQRELEAARAYAAELEAAREHDRDLAEKLRAAEIKIVGLESE